MRRICVASPAKVGLYRAPVQSISLHATALSEPGSVMVMVSPSAAKELASK